MARTLQSLRHSRPPLALSLVGVVFSGILVPALAFRPRFSSATRNARLRLFNDMATEFRSAAGMEGDLLGEKFTVCTTDAGVILSGYDTTSYFAEGAAEPILGDASISVEYQGATYHFASEENKAKFEAAPEAFAPAFGAFCAKATADDALFFADPKTFRIQDGRLLVFFNNGEINTKTMWEEGDVDEKLAAATANWVAGTPIVQMAGGGKQPSE